MVTQINKRSGGEKDNVSAEKKARRSLVPLITDSIDTENSVKRAIDALSRTALDEFCKDTGEEKHAALVCVVCDTFIIGMEPSFWISVDTLLQNQSRLSVESFENFSGSSLNPLLVSQYSVDDDRLKGLLLSPRARKKGNSYLACKACKTSLRTQNRNSGPPRFAIANGWMIGSIPKSVLPNVSELLSALIAPVRPFAYIFSYSGGAHKTIRGNFTFFKNNIDHIGGVLQTYQQTGANNNVYAIMCGRFTPKQRQIIKDKLSLDLRDYSKLLNWLIDNGHPAFKNVCRPGKCPKPTMVQEEPNDQNTDEEKEPSIEQHYDGSYFFYPDAHEPTQDTGSFSDTHAFAKAMVQGSMPTLLFHGGEYAAEQLVAIQDIFPDIFPFGIGGTKDIRRTNISEFECIRHYMRLALPQMHRPMFVLVVNSMFNRIKAFTTGFIRCKSLLRGQSLAEQVAKMTEKDLISASARASMRLPQAGSTGSKFLDTVTAACKPIGHSNEAAKEGRKRFFAMRNHFGSQAVFFTFSPCDERTFRVRLFATSGKHALPSLNWTDEKCLADLTFRRNIRLQYPGACSLEYQSMMQILIQALIGWDPETKTGKKGIFGIPQAFGNADEEQGRKSVHGHMSIWIEDFNAIRELLYNEDKSVARDALNELKSYLERVMCSSYGNLIISPHGCSSRKRKDFSQVSDQSLRDMRHKVLCQQNKGTIATCSTCNFSFSTTEIVNNALNRWNMMSTYPMSNAGTFPLPSHRMDIFTMRHFYDVHAMPPLSCCTDSAPCSIKHNKEARECILKLQTNEHDFLHRPSCFKKGIECRHHHPFSIWEKLTVDFGEQTIQWPYLDGSFKTVSPFLVSTKRQHGDQFLNTHNPIASSIFSSNTNVQVGDHGHIFYSTLYSSTANQKEETKTFMNVTNAISRRIHRQINQAQINDNNEVQDDFVEGLSRVLSGIRAHMSASIISPPLAHLLVCQQSRFTFSHDFGYLHVSQIEAFFDGQPTSFTIRRQKSEKDTNNQWLDSAVNDVIYRPSELENVSAYEMIMYYERVSHTRNKTCRSKSFSFLENHPGRHAISLKKVKHFKIPMVSVSQEGFDDISDLKIGENNVNEMTQSIRERYARRALIMFLPMRCENDLKSPKDGSFWTLFQDSMKNKDLFLTKKGVEILHNIQTSKSAQKLKRPLDFIASKTMCKKVEDDCSDNNKKDDTDYDIEEITSLMQQEESFCNNNLISSTHKILQRRSMINSNNLILAPATYEPVIVTDEVDNHNKETRKKPSKDQEQKKQKPFPAIVEIVKGAMIRLQTSNTPHTNNTTVTLHPISSFAQKAELDERQHQALQVICCTFILSWLDELKTHDQHRVACGQVLEGMFGLEQQKYEEVVEILTEHGANRHLFFYLSGAGGSGKSRVIRTAREYCHHFCHITALPFEKEAIYLTATIGSAAALLGGGTIHGASGMNRSKLDDKFVAAWKAVRILVIDEISFFSESDFITLDKKLRYIRGVPDKMYGGLPIVIAGDFHQMKAFSGTPLYKCNWTEHWHGILNCYMFLTNDHRFKNDPEYGQILGRLRVGNATKEDIIRINERWLGNDSVKVPSCNNTCYACPYNKDRNAISTSIFSNHVDNTHSFVNELECGIPKDTIIIQSSLRKGNSKCSHEFHTTVYDNCGDADITTCKNKRIDPALKLYHGIPLMINNNDDINEGRANGTLCTFTGIKLKKGVNLTWKNWDGRRVHTVSVDDVEYITCRHYKDSLQKIKVFKLYPEKDSVHLSLRLLGNIVKVGGVRITQFPVNSNIATTGHKLQGMTKDALIVHSWNYSFENWVYVVLSRVTTRAGLFLCQKLDEDREFPCDPDLLKEEKRLARIEADFLSKLSFTHYRDSEPAKIMRRVHSKSDEALKITKKSLISDQPHSSLSTLSSPTIWMKINNLTLWMSDYESMCSNNYFTDVVLDAFSSLLRNEGAFSVLNTRFFSYLATHGWNDETRDDFISQTIAGLESDFLIIPIHSSYPDHWSLLIRRSLNHSTRTYSFLYIDTLCNERNLAQVSNVIKNTPLFDTARGDTIQTLSVPRQTEVECGALVCLYMFLLRPNSTQFDYKITQLSFITDLACKAREWVRQCLQEGCISAPSWLK